LERQGQRSISEDRIKELTSLIEDLNLDRNRIRAELDGIRVDRDRLQLRVGDLERALQQRPAQASQELEIYAKKIAELDREKQALLVEISRLRTTM
jgi:predicted  nucleic acid-binding Zn-ribbon protein